MLYVINVYMYVLKIPLSIKMKLLVIYLKLDKTFTIGPNYTYEVIYRAAFQSKLLQKLDFLDLFKNKLSLRFYYSSPLRNISEEEAKKELDKIKESV